MKALRNSSLIGSLLTAASLAAQAGEPAVVPLRLVENGLYPAAFALVQVQIGDESAQMLLDTGASLHVLTEDLLRRLDLPAERIATLVGASGRRRAPRFRLPSIRIGGTEVEGHSATVVPANAVFERIEAQYDLRIDGILGTPLFSDGPVTLDFARGELALHPREGWEAPEGEAIPLRFRGGVPVVTARIADQQDADFLFDTGHSNTLLVHAAHARSHDMLARADSLLQYGMEGVFGMTRAFMGTLDSFHIGGHELRSFPATVVAETSGGRGITEAEGLAGNIGLALISRFRVTLDYGERRLWLQARTGAEALSPDYGMSLAHRDGAVIVLEVGDGSPAERAGLRLGDRIERVNDRPCPERIGDVIRALRRQERVELRIRRSASRSWDALLIRRDFLPQILGSGH